ncbi:DUF421 domain-containing protein [Neobacillus cucumis]|uniref:DUF421 domain-containing protein n=1 Tax=Neobacillus cucumis TaxID=1740721 RepID=UPI00285311BD|nr:DUF421 domain-containing protein [Neobacillus cucumis]MDR4945409.1 DUF421 domain-containing protein [Neobacillus cucumis]
MDFAQAHDTLTITEWILRAIVVFIFLLIVAKFLGQRAISQLRLLDFVIALVIGNIIAHPLSDDHLNLKGSMTTTIVLAVLYIGGIFLNLKFPWFRKLVNHAPITLIQDGKIIYKALKKARISIDVLLEELRQEKVSDLKKVALAIWEADGKISVFIDPKYEPITPAACQMNTDPFELPRTIIKEGRFNLAELKQIHKNETWVISALERLYQTEVKDVLLATLDSKDNLKVFLYK